MSAQNGEEPEARPTNFSKWVERHVIQRLVERNGDPVRVIVLGRFPLSDELTEKAYCKVRALCGLSYEDAEAFWSKALNEERAKASRHFLTLESDNSLKKEIFQLCEGRPIFLAALCDYLNSSDSKADRIVERVRILEERMTRQEAFEHVLIANLTEIAELTPTRELNVSDDRRPNPLTFMSLAERRMNPQILKHLFSVEYPEAKWSDESCREALQRIRDWSFVRERGEDLVLHDEMARMINRHHWQTQYEKNHQAVMAKLRKKLVEFYDKHLLKKKNLSPAARHDYISEACAYAVAADPSIAIPQRLLSTFESALYDGRHDHADRMLRDAEAFAAKHPEALSRKAVVELALMRVRYFVDVDRDFAAARKLLSSIEARFADESGWESSVEYGRWLFARGHFELWQSNYREAVKLFKEAEKLFYGFGRDFERYQTLNLLGYSSIFTCNFEEAERCLINSIHGFVETIINRAQDAETQQRCLREAQYCPGNLATLYRLTGRWEEAAAAIDLKLILQNYLPENSKERARAHVAAALVYGYSGRTVEAQRHWEIAKGLIGKITIPKSGQQGELSEECLINDRVLHGRLFINRTYVDYSHPAVLNRLEFSRAGKNKGVCHFENEQEYADILATISKAISILEQGPQPVTLELAQACFIQGEIHMLTSDKIDARHWEKAEKSMLKALELGRKADFEYRIGALAPVFGAAVLLLAGKRQSCARRRRAPDNRKEEARLRE